MAQQNEEHMLTITLSPKFFNNNRIASQLLHSYHHIRRAFKTGMGCLEFTEQGNVHYHVKTQDDISDIHVFFDKLKGVRVKQHDEKIYIFGFTKCDVTKKKEKLKDYCYITKCAERSDQTLKKLNISDKYHAIWEYAERYSSTSSFNVIKGSKSKTKKKMERTFYKLFEKSLDPSKSTLQSVEEEDSDTFDMISTGTGGYYEKVGIKDNLD
jgi:hypothetical protein